MPLIWTGPVEQEIPQYTGEELERYEKRGAKITNKRWLQSEDGRLIIPKSAQWKRFTPEFSFGYREYLPAGFSLI